MGNVTRILAVVLLLASMWQVSEPLRGAAKAARTPRCGCCPAGSVCHCCCTPAKRSDSIPADEPVKPADGNAICACDQPMTTLPTVETPHRAIAAAFAAADRAVIALQLPVTIGLDTTARAHAPPPDLSSIQTVVIVA